MKGQHDDGPAGAKPETRRERVGISIGATDAQALVALIEQAEAAGVEQLWMTQNPVSTDTLTVYAAAMGRTERVRLGTSIVPTYPRHPLALVQQAATVAALGSGRLRLGVGPTCARRPRSAWPATRACPFTRICSRRPDFRWTTMGT